MHRTAPLVNAFGFLYLPILRFEDFTAICLAIRGFRTIGYGVVLDLVGMLAGWRLSLDHAQFCNWYQ